MGWPLPLLTSVYGSSNEIFLYSKASEAEILTCVRRRYLTSFASLHFENYLELTELDAAEDRQKCI